MPNDNVDYKIYINERNVQVKYGRFTGVSNRGVSQRGVLDHLLNTSGLVYVRPIKYYGTMYAHVRQQYKNVDLRLLTEHFSHTA